MLAYTIRTNLEMMVKLILKEDMQIEEIIIHIKNYLKQKIIAIDRIKHMIKIMKISLTLPS